MAEPFHDPNQWWVGQVLYQVYPRSYMDSDGDGALREDVGVSRPIDCGHDAPARFQLLRDASGTREQIQGASTTARGEEGAEHADESSLRTQILDRHAPATVVAHSWRSRVAGLLAWARAR